MKNLLSLIIFTSFAAPAFAQAGGINFDTKKPICLKREYTPEHMSKNPKQKLSAIYLKVETKKVVAEDGETYSYKGADVVGISSKTYFANNAATCELEKNGYLHCFVECDGGSFNVKPKKASAMIQVSRNYYFPLFKSGVPQYGDDLKESDLVSLNSGSADDNFLVYPAPTKDCDNAYKQYKMMKPEGCG